MATPKRRTVARGIRIPDEVDTWLRRSAAKQNKSVNELAAEHLRKAYEARHAK